MSPALIEKQGGHVTIIENGKKTFVTLVDGTEVEIEGLMNGFFVLTHNLLVGKGDHNVSNSLGFPLKDGTVKPILED